MVEKALEKGIPVLYRSGNSGHLISDAPIIGISRSNGKRRRQPDRGSLAAAGQGGSVVWEYRLSQPSRTNSTEKEVLVMELSSSN